MLTRRLAKLFLEHPSAVGETYGEHFWQALRIGVGLIVIGGACCIHALFPGLFVNTASTRIRSLAADLDKRLGPAQPSTLPPAANPAGDFQVP